MTPRLLVIGAGGFARETLDVAHALVGSASERSVVGVVDDAPSPEARALLRDRGVAIVGTVEEFLDDALAVEYDEYVVAIGAPSARARLVARAPSGRRAAAALVHPSASIGSRSTLGVGTVVCAGAVLSTNVVVGDHGHINPNATIGHDVRLGTCVSVNPAAVVSGAVDVADAALLGAASVVLQGLTIGMRSIVGAAACVTKDVEPDSVVKGVPAR